MTDEKSLRAMTEAETNEMRRYCGAPSNRISVVAQGMRVRLIRALDTIDSLRSALTASEARAERLEREVRRGDEAVRAAQAFLHDEEAIRREAAEAKEAAAEQKRWRDELQEAVDALLEADASGDDSVVGVAMERLLTCIAFVCADHRSRDEGGPWFYEWVTTRSYRDQANGGDRSFGAAVLWAMRGQDREGTDGADVTAADEPEEWLSYVEHVVGYRTGPGNGHARTSQEKS